MKHECLRVQHLFGCTAFICRLHSESKEGTLPLIACHLFINTQCVDEQFKIPTFRKQQRHLSYLCLSITYLTMRSHSDGYFCKEHTGMQMKLFT